MVTKQAPVSILMDAATAPSLQPDKTRELDTSEAEGGQHCTFPWEMLSTSKICLNCKQLNHSSLLHHAVWAGQPGSGTLMETHGEQ